MSPVTLIVFALIQIRVRERARIRSRFEYLIFREE